MITRHVRKTDSMEFVRHSYFFMKRYSFVTYGTMLMWYGDLAIEDCRRIWKCVIVVPTSIVYSHTCNAIAVMKISTHVSPHV